MTRYGMHIRMIQKRDISDLDTLFIDCIADLVKRENKEQELIKEEVDQLNRIVKEALADSETQFFVAEIDEQIVGTIAQKNPNQLITENIEIEPNVYEIASVYIHPSYQRQGIGKTLFHHVKNELIRQGHKKFYLDAGFSSSQQYWEDILGKPSFILKDYWGKGEHHLIWVKSI